MRLSQMRFRVHLGVSIQASIPQGPKRQGVGGVTGRTRGGATGGDVTVRYVRRGGARQGRL